MAPSRGRAGLGGIPPVVLSTFFLFALLVSTYADLAAPDPPTVLLRTDTTVSLGWALPTDEGGETAVFNLALGANSIYTGRSTSFTVRDLAPDSCYSFRLKALYEGQGWSPESPLLRVSTLPSSNGQVNMPSLQTELALKRKKIRESALAEFSADPCPLAGLGHPEYAYGSVYSVSYRASLDRTSPIGRDISIVNCDLAKCAPRLDKTAPFDGGGGGGAKQGRIDVAIGMDWQLGLLPQMENRFVAMSSEQPTLAWTEPKSGRKTVLPLMGCRAAPVVTQEDLTMNALLPSLADRGEAMEREKQRVPEDSGKPSSSPSPATSPAAAGGAFLELGRASGSSKSAGRRSSALALRGAVLTKDGPSSPSSSSPDNPPPTTRRRTARGLPLLHVGCFELNCTATALQYLFCSPLPPKAEGPDAEESDEEYERRINSDPKSKPLREAMDWAEALNYASLGLRLPYRYEITASLAASQQAADDNRRPRNKGYLESAAWREAWVLSFLSALPLSGATPHFPVLFDAYSCNKLPELFASPVFPADGGSTGSLTGALPLSLPGGMATTVGASITNKGGGGEGGGGGGGEAGSTYNWAVLYSETSQTDLSAIFASYAQQSDTLPGSWFRGILFQIIYSLSVARHAFGLHHNGLLTLSNVKVVQVPKGSPGYRQYDCYRTTPEVIAGVPLLIPKGKNAPALPSKDEEDSNGEDAEGTSAFKDNLVSGRSTRGDPESLYILDTNRLDFDACVREDRQKKLQQQRETAGKQLSEEVVAALARGEKLPSPSPEPVPAAPKILYGPAGSSLAPTPAEERTGWCVPAADVYGLRVKIGGGYGSSSLVRKQLEWWSQLGYSFPNTAWRDDLKDLAISFCGPAAEKVIGFRTYAKGMAADICHRMLEGEYALNPAAALRHPLFSGLAGSGSPRNEDDDDPSSSLPYLGLATPESLETWQRSLYTYSPLALGGALRKPLSQSEKNKWRKKGGKKDSSPFALYPDDAEVPRSVLLASLVPRKPWLLKKDSLSAVVGWEPHDKATLPRWVVKLLPAPPTTFNLFVDGKSVYSGPQLKHAVSLLRKRVDSSNNDNHNGCVLRVQVTAFYPSLGWTDKSSPLEIQAASGQGC